MHAVILKPVADFNSKLISQSVKVWGNVHDMVKGKKSTFKTAYMICSQFCVTKKKKKKEKSHQQTVETARNKSKCQGWLYQNVKTGGIMNDF